MNELTQQHELPAVDPPNYTKGEFRAAIMETQEFMLTLDNVEAPVKHHFAPGNYAREIFLPEGMRIIGKIHRHAHVNVISQGEVVVMTEDGRKHLKAPCTFISEPGTKRLVHAVKDTVWTTIHPTDETDLEKIEEAVIAPTYDDLLLIEGGKP